MGPFRLVPRKFCSFSTSCVCCLWVQDKPKDAHVINVLFEDQHWDLPGTGAQWPHDIALGAAPMVLSGAWRIASGYCMRG